ncbi:hypothetical protein M409DRAFT_17826 [Zasmidium cellare ATCC 36951]|uniref:Uncharacterized protein n=1 Tax=Zasmidium cellare ATCC 36951 TaxID=1080233 RepID=A0A6A6D1R0_ZASCE|nr:uncharacterized protein M409DRAFT_17826 [Zasmidium cellare ATCC 36951]KAF2171586.1 hypothetical protein M409DRAFT_17826 [Zasmidium cellare ATCC 36951]
MPPGQTIPANLSFAVARQVLKPEDMERLACAFLNATETFDADKAAREFGKCKADSFKRSIWVITKTLKEHGGDIDGDGDPAAAKPKQRGRKRKADGDEGEPSPKKKDRGAKKSKAETEEDADDEAPVKAERKDDESSEENLV